MRHDLVFEGGLSETYWTILMVRIQMMLNDVKEECCGVKVKLLYSRRMCERELK